jgi:hypothetical protein
VIDTKSVGVQEEQQTKHRGGNFSWGRMFKTNFLQSTSSSTSGDGVSENQQPRRSSGSSGSGRRSKTLSGRFSWTDVVDQNEPSSFIEVDLLSKDKTYYRYAV